MVNKKEHLLTINLFLLFLLAFLFFMNHSCKTPLQKRSEKKAKKDAEQQKVVPLSIHRLNGVDLLATAKGEFFFKDERVRFHALLRASQSHKMRIEMFNTFGKTLFVYIYNQPQISLYIPSMKALYRGSASSENMFKLLGIELDAEEIMNLLTGMEQYYSVNRQGFFASALVNDNLSWKKISSLDELWKLLHEGGTLLLKDPIDNQIQNVQIFSHYFTDPHQEDCFLIVPREIEISLKKHLIRLKIRIENIRSYILYAGGHIHCGLLKEQLSSHKENTFTDLAYEEMPRVDLYDLDRIEVNRPLFMEE